MERASSTVTSKPKILPVVLLSSIPLKLFSSGKEKRYGKLNIRLNRTQPYEADNQRSLSERTSCSNCNKQTNNQSSSISSTIQAVSSMIQSPMLILPIVSAATTKSAISQAKIHSNVYCNHQHQQQQQLHQPVYFAAKKVDELNIGGNNGTVCRVREISCSFKHTNYNFFPSCYTPWHCFILPLVCSVASSFFIHFPRNEFLCRNIHIQSEKSFFLRGDKRNNNSTTKA